MDQIIFLVGARASGKTTLGKMLANELGYSFIDTDSYLFETTQKTVTEIVADEGWDGFRKKESQALVNVAQPNCVIATGGGMVLAEHNRHFMKKKGTVIFLSAPAVILAERLSNDPNIEQRPSLTGLSIVDEIEKVLNDRLVLYHDAAHYIVDVTQQELQIIKQLLDILSS